MGKESSSEKIQNEQAATDTLQGLNLYTGTIQIQKLAETSRIGDCTEELWAFTGHIERKTRYPVFGNYPLIKDLGYPVWRCRMGIKYEWHYGKSLIEAVLKATNKKKPE